MIHSVTVTNHLGESLTLELGSPEKSGLLIREITGLGPPQANINSYDLATIDGSRFVNSRVQTRNIVLTVMPILTPNSSVEDNRLKVYRYFPIKQQIRFAVQTDNRNAYVTGYVESNEADIFSNEETLTVSILCPDPYFYESGDGQTIVFTGIESVFEFAFSNESLSDNLLEVSAVKSLKSKTFEYVGDAEIGFIISIRILDTVSGDILIYNPTTHETMTLNTAKITPGLHPNDYINISTVKGKKYIQHVRGSAITNVINAMDHDSDWFTLKKGLNTIIYTADTGEDNMYLSIIFNPAYQGV